MTKCVVVAWFFLSNKHSQSSLMGIQLIHDLYLFIFLCRCTCTCIMLQQDIFLDFLRVQKQEQKQPSLVSF